MHFFNSLVIFIYLMHKCIGISIFISYHRLQKFRQKSTFFKLKKKKLIKGIQ